MGKQSREKWERLSRRNLGEDKREDREITPQSGLEKTCLFIIRWGVYLILFTPLIIHKSFFFPFVAPKTIFFRIMVEIILAAYLFLAITARNYRPKINILTVAIALFLGIFILSSFVGVNPDRSFWSTNERMTGVWTMLHLFAFFIVLVSVFKRRKDWERALGVSIIVGVLLSLYVLSGDELSSRGGGTIGNTSFMAAYLLFDIFFAIILFLAKRGAWQIFTGLSLLVMLPVLFTSSARGAIVAFFLGVGLLILGYLFFSQSKTLKRTAVAIVLVLVIFAIILTIAQPAFLKSEIEHTIREMRSRFVVWETGWQGFLERPILGWGPENFNNVFLKYFNP
jgi:O-antigen ligase